MKKKKGDEITGGSVIDLVLSNSVHNIDNMSIDTHPIFYDHRPIVFSLKSTNCKVEACDKHYIFRSEIPNKTLLKAHNDLLAKSNKHIQTFIDKVFSVNNLNQNDLEFISNIGTLASIFTIHLANIKAFGMYNSDWMNDWVEVDQEQIELRLKKKQLNNTNFNINNNPNKLIKQAEQLFMDKISKQKK
eukprot:184683_1